MQKKVLLLGLVLIVIMSGCALHAPSTPSQNKPSELSINSLDVCGEKEQYAQAAWYPEFLAAVQKADRLNPFDLQTQGTGEDSTSNFALKLTAEDLGEMCFLDDEAVVLALIPGSHGGTSFKLLQYDTIKKSLQVATREDAEGGPQTPWYKAQRALYTDQTAQSFYLWFIPPTHFVKREGNMMLLSGQGGDGACSESATYGYNLDSNYLFITRGCGQCADEAERCTDYRDQNEL